MITKFFLKRYDFKVLAYKSSQVFILFFLTIILFLGLVTYDEFDPSPFSVGDEKPNNLLKFYQHILPFFYKAFYYLKHAFYSSITQQRPIG